MSRLPVRLWLLVLSLVVAAYFAGTMNIFPSIRFLSSNNLQPHSTIVPSQSSQPQSYSAPLPSSQSSLRSSSLNPPVVQAQQQLSNLDAGDKISTTTHDLSSSSSE